MLEQLKAAKDELAKWKTLDVARQHANWEKNRREREQKRQDDQEVERRAYIHTFAFL
jgi:splicing factor 3A subunit 1